MSPFDPLKEMSREEVLARSDAVRAMPDVPTAETEDIFRIEALGLEWAMGASLYQPSAPDKIAPTVAREQEIFGRLIKSGRVKLEQN